MKTFVKLKRSKVYVLSISNIKTILRTSDWWNHIIPPVMGFYGLALLEAGAFRPDIIEVMNVFLLMFFLAVFGFTLGEWTDLDDDARAGKTNRLKDISPGMRLGLTGGSLLIVLLFARLLDPGPVGWALLGGQVMAFVLYSVPPFRWKRFPWPAALLDSIYSGTLMYLLVCTLHLNAGWRMWLPLVAWGLLRGIRNYLIHTVLDAVNDEKRGIPTPALILGSERIAWLLYRVVLPLECLSMVFFLAGMTMSDKWIFLTLYILTLGFAAFHETLDKGLRGLGILVNINLYHELVLWMAALGLLALHEPLWILGIAASLLLFDGYRLWIAALWQRWKSWF